MVASAHPCFLALWLRARRGKVQKIAYVSVPQTILRDHAPRYLLKLE